MIGAGQEIFQNINEGGKAASHPDRPYESMSEKKTYDSDQIKDAKKLADVLISVKGESRPVFALMVESMLIGAELAEKGIARTA